MRTFKGGLGRCGSGLYYYFWFFFYLSAIVWNTFAVAAVEVAEVVMEAMVGDGVGGLLIGGPLSDMTMNNA